MLVLRFANENRSWGYLRIQVRRRKKSSKFGKSAYRSNRT